MGWLIGRVLFTGPPHDGPVGDHPSPDAVADTLQRPTHELGRTTLERSLSGLAPGGVCLATTVTRRAGGLLHHRFTLTSTPIRRQGRWRSVLCGTDPAGHPGWALPTTLSCGARTFLDTPRNQPRGDAVARPAHPPGKDRAFQRVKRTVRVVGSASVSVTVTSSPTGSGDVDTTGSSTAGSRTITFPVRSSSCATSSTTPSKVSPTRVRRVSASTR